MERDLCTGFGQWRFGWVNQKSVNPAVLFINFPGILELPGGRSPGSFERIFCGRKLEGLSHLHESVEVRSILAYRLHKNGTKWEQNTKTGNSKCWGMCYHVNTELCVLTENAHHSCRFLVHTVCDVWEIFSATHFWNNVPHALCRFLLILPGMTLNPHSLRLFFVLCCVALKSSASSSVHCKTLRLTMQHCSATVVIAYILNVPRTTRKLKTLRPFKLAGNSFSF